MLRPIDSNRKARRKIDDLDKDESEEHYRRYECGNP